MRSDAARLRGASRRIFAHGEGGGAICKLGHTDEANIVTADRSKEGFFERLCPRKRPIEETNGTDFAVIVG